MDSEKWADYRVRLHPLLITTRSRVQHLRIKTVGALRDHDHVSVNKWLFKETGRRLDYPNSLAAGLSFIDTVAPDWSIKFVEGHGEYYRMVMSDCSGRGRDDFVNKWVSPRLEYTFIYMGLSTWMIDLNTQIDELMG